MSSEPQRRPHDVAPEDLRIPAGVLSQPASFWVASLASLGIIIGGIGPWATYLNYVSISGTSMHGWREVAVGAVALVMLGLYQMSGWRPPLIGAGVVGVLGLIGAIDALHSITSGGAVTVLGITYRFISAAWGVYLVLAGTIVLTLCIALLMWQVFRSRSHAM